MAITICDTTVEEQTTAPVNVGRPGTLQYTLSNPGGDAGSQFVVEGSNDMRGWLPVWSKAGGVSAPNLVTDVALIDAPWNAYRVRILDLMPGTRIVVSFGG